MAASLGDKLVVAISSRALFNLEEENRLFESGDSEGYMRLQFERLDVQGRAARLVRETGVDAFFRQRGMTQQQIDQCLADPRNLQRVADDTDRAQRNDGVTGTPTFFINNTQAPPNTGLWPQLEPLLRRATGG